MLIRILALVLLSFAAVNAFGKSAEERCWEENSPLSWEDFKGDAPAQTANAAMTHISIGYEMPSKNRVIVTNCMIEDKSWVLPASKNTKILMHEQGHFNIAEVYARRIRKEVSSLDTHSLDKVKSVFKKWIRQYNREQALYDKETKHSQIEEQQARWQDKINRELDELAPYKETRVSINP